MTPRFLALVALAGLTPLHAAPAKQKPARAPAAPVELELVSQLPAEKAEALRMVVERFNARSPAAQVRISERSWSQGALPELMILDATDKARLLEDRNRVRPVAAVMASAKEKLDTAKAAATVVSPSLFDKTGKLAALPVGLETPVLFINKAVFSTAGLDPLQPPRTWAQVQEAAGRLADTQVGCPLAVVKPATVLLEQSAAWHNEPFAGADGTLQANKMQFVRHIARMASWQKARYLHILGHGDEAIGHFARGECAMLIAGQAAMPTFEKAGLQVAVTMLPYYDDVAGAPQNTLADGPALWVAASATAAEQMVAARFIAFWLEPQQQIDWQRATGYLPLNRAGAFAASSQLIGPELQHVRVAIEQLTRKPATPQSRATVQGESERVRAVLNTELDRVWRDGTPAKQALDDAVGRLPRAAAPRAR